MPYLNHIATGCAIGMTAKGFRDIYEQAGLLNAQVVPLVYGTADDTFVSFFKQVKNIESEPDDNNPLGETESEGEDDYNPKSMDTETVYMFQHTGQNTKKLSQMNIETGETIIRHVTLLSTEEQRETFHMVRNVKVVLEEIGDGGTGLIRIKYEDGMSICTLVKDHPMTALHVDNGGDGDYTVALLRPAGVAKQGASNSNKTLYTLHAHCCARTAIYEKWKDSAKHKVDIVDQLHHALRVTKAINVPSYSKYTRYCGRNDADSQCGPVTDDERMAFSHLSLGNLGGDLHWRGGENVPHAKRYTTTDVRLLMVDKDDNATYRGGVHINTQILAELARISDAGADTTKVTELKCITENPPGSNDLGEAGVDYFIRTAHEMRWVKKPLYPPGVTPSISAHFYYRMSYEGHRATTSSWTNLVDVADPNDPGESAVDEFWLRKYNMYQAQAEIAFCKWVLDSEDYRDAHVTVQEKLNGIRDELRRDMVLSALRNVSHYEFRGKYGDNSDSDSDDEHESDYDFIAKKVRTLRAKNDPHIGVLYTRVGEQAHALMEYSAVRATIQAGYPCWYHPKFDRLVYHKNQRDNKPKQREVANALQRITRWANGEAIGGASLPVENGAYYNNDIFETTIDSQNSYNATTELDACIRFKNNIKRCMDAHIQSLGLTYEFVAIEYPVYNPFCLVADAEGQMPSKFVSTVIDAVIYTNDKKLIIVEYKDLLEPIVLPPPPHKDQDEDDMSRYLFDPRLQRENDTEYTSRRRRIVNRILHSDPQKQVLTCAFLFHMQTGIKPDYILTVHATRAGGPARGIRRRRLVPADENNQAKYDDLTDNLQGHRLIGAIRQSPYELDATQFPARACMVSRLLMLPGKDKTTKANLTVAYMDNHYFIPDLNALVRSNRRYGQPYGSSKTQSLYDTLPFFHYNRVRDDAKDAREYARLNRWYPLLEIFHLLELFYSAGHDENSDDRVRYKDFMFCSYTSSDTKKRGLIPQYAYLENQSKRKDKPSRKKKTRRDADSENEDGDGTSGQNDRGAHPMLPYIDRINLLSTLWLTGVRRVLESSDDVELTFEETVDRLAGVTNADGISDFIPFLPITAMSTKQFTSHVPKLPELSKAENDTIEMRARYIIARIPIETGRGNIKSMEEAIPHLWQTQRMKSISIDTAKYHIPRVATAPPIERPSAIAQFNLWDPDCDATENEKLRIVLNHNVHKHAEHVATFIENWLRRHVDIKSQSKAEVSKYCSHVWQAMLLFHELRAPADVQLSGHALQEGRSFDVTRPGLVPHYVFSEEGGGRRGAYRNSESYFKAHDSAQWHKHFVTMSIRTIHRIINSRILRACVPTEYTTTSETVRVSRAKNSTIDAMHASLACRQMRTQSASLPTEALRRAALQWDNTRETRQFQRTPYMDGEICGAVGINTRQARALFIPEAVEHRQAMQTFLHTSNRKAWHTQLLELASPLQVELAARDLQQHIATAMPSLCEVSPDAKPSSYKTRKNRVSVAAQYMKAESQHMAHVSLA